MEQTTICWLNLHSPAVMELEESILPEGFRLLRPKDETDMDEVHHLMEQADYLIAMNVSREEMQHYCKRVRLSFAVRYHCDEGQRGKFVNVTAVILFVV